MVRLNKSILSVEKQKSFWKLSKTISKTSKANIKSKYQKAIAFVEHRFQSWKTTKTACSFKHYSTRCSMEPFFGVILCFI